jgi:hypothetical protein
MSAGGILFWGVLLCLAWIAGIGIYFEMASSRRRKLPAVSLASAAVQGRATRRPEVDVEGGGQGTLQ